MGQARPHPAERPRGGGSPHQCHGGGSHPHTRHRQAPWPRARLPESQWGRQAACMARPLNGEDKILLEMAPSASCFQTPECTRTLWLPTRSTKHVYRAPRRASIVSICNLSEWSKRESCWLYIKVIFSQGLIRVRSNLGGHESPKVYNCTEPIRHAVTFSEQLVVISSCTQRQRRGHIQRHMQTNLETETDTQRHKETHAERDTEDKDIQRDTRRETYRHLQRDIHKQTRTETQRTH